MTVLVGIHPLLTADLLHAMASMGHGDELALVDVKGVVNRYDPR